MRDRNSVLTFEATCYREIVTSQERLPGEDVSPGLALVNTWHNSPVGVVEHLLSTGQARQWLIDRNLLASDVPFGVDDLDRLYALRRSIRDLLESRARGTLPSAESVDSVNSIASASPLAPRLAWDATGPSVTTGPPGRSLQQCLAVLACGTIELVCGPLAERLLVCGAPGCVRMIVHDHPRRRWCSRGCGDRVRAARYYAKHHLNQDR
jgi:predicted RNA-binding Zn ribbon-like protein